MFRSVHEYKSRFRILKGGKISLVVSALLVGSSMVGTSLYAAEVITGTQTTTQQYDYSGGGDTDVDLLVSTGSIEVSNTGLQTAVDVIRPSASLYATTITNNGTISADSTDNSNSTGISIKGDSLAPTVGDVTITNAGAIATTTGEGKGIYIAYHDSLMHILNDTAGTITSSTFGLNFKDINFQSGSTITNSGLIHAETANGNYASAIYIYNDSATTLSGMITNHAGDGTATGVISAQADNGKAKGIDLYAYNVDGLHLTNSGTISSTAGNEAYGIQFRSNSSLNINNTTISNELGAEISAISTSSNAIGIDFYSGNDYIYLNNTSIINAGSISAEVADGRAYGIRMYSNSGTYIYDSSITNSGTISALAGDNGTAYGIYAGKMNGSHISNSGTISATAGSYGSSRAIYTADMMTSSYISNSGTISATAGHHGYAYGLNIGNMGDLSYINNIGTISVLADHDSYAYGLNIGNMGDSSYISNSGTISATVGYSGTAKGINIGSLSSYISNSGTISALAADHDSNAYGIYIGNMSSVSHIINSGTISATAGYNGSAKAIYIGNMSYSSYISNTSGKTISAEVGNNGSAVGINIGNLYNTAHITNGGTISVTAGSNSTARGIDSGYLRDNSYIKNSTSGTFSISGTDAYGIMASMDTSATISNEGSISVNGTNSAYGIMINNSIMGSAITNSGTITATINNQADVSGYSLQTQGDVSIHNTSTGNLNGNLAVFGTLTNDGSIRLPYNANSSTSRATVGDFIQSSTGILEIGLNTSADGVVTNKYSQLSTNNATFANGSTINVNVLTTGANQNLLVGKTLTDVVSATTNLTLDGTLSVTDNSALLNFEYVLDGGTIDLNVVQGTTLLDSVVSGGGSTNTQAAGHALQTIQDNGSFTAMNSYIAALNTLGTDTEVAHAILSTTPMATTATSTASTQIANGIQGMVGVRQSSTMGAGGMNSGDIALRDQNLWIKPFGSKGKQDKKDGINGFNVKAYGFGMGYDAEVAPKQRFGAAFFYTAASVDVNGMPQTSDLKIYTALIYGNTPLNSNTDFLYQAGYSWQKTNSERTILPTYDHAKAEYTSKTASLDLKLMQNYKIDNALSIRPLVETTYRHNTSPSYSESGAGAMNLNVNAFTSTQLIIGGGAIIDYKLDKKSALVSELEVGYDLRHNAQTVTSSYQGATGVDFTTAGIDNGGWRYNVGLGYDMASILGGELNFMYNYQAQGSSFDNHMLSAKYIYKF